MDNAAGQINSKKRSNFVFNEYTKCDLCKSGMNETVTNILFIFVHFILPINVIDSNTTIYFWYIVSIKNIEARLSPLRKESISPRYGS